MLKIANTYRLYFNVNNENFSLSQMNRMLCCVVPSQLVLIFVFKGMFVINSESWYFLPHTDISLSLILYSYTADLGENGGRAFDFVLRIELLKAYKSRQMRMKWNGRSEEKTFLYTLSFSSFSYSTVFVSHNNVQVKNNSDKGKKTLRRMNERNKERMEKNWWRKGR